LTKNEKRLAAILARVPLAREQLLVAMEQFGSDFDLTAFVSAAEHVDPAERNKVAVVEREIDLLTNLLEELAARALDEARRLGAVERGSGHPWDRLAAEKAIPASVADRLRETKDTRNDLDHFYPPANWRAVHHATRTIVAELDDYVIRVVGWARDQGIDVPVDSEASRD
jgi:hypothetical protein